MKAEAKNASPVKIAILSIAAIVVLLGVISTYQTLTAPVSGQTEMDEVDRHLKEFEALRKKNGENR